ncbi:hypothetical protein C0991_008178, partial [Blastosporella zonata]
MDVDPAPAGGPSAASARRRPTSPAPARRRMGASGWRGDNAMEVDLVSTSNDGWIQRMRRMGEGEKRVLRRVQNNIADLREMMEEEQHRRTTAMEIIHQALLTQGEELRNLHTLTHGCLDDVQELSSEMRRQGNTLHQMGLDIEQVVGLGIRLTELEDQFQMMGYEDPMEERQGAGERLVRLYSGVNTGRYYTDLGTNDQVERQVQAQERAEVESPGGEDDLTRETRLADEADMELQVVAMTAARDSSGTAGTPPTLPSTVGTTGTPTIDVLLALHNTGIAASAGEDINGTPTAYVPAALNMTGTAATIVSAGAATDKLLNAAALA